MASSKVVPADSEVLFEVHKDFIRTPKGKVNDRKLFK
jgi:hypothetical protein